MNDDRLAWNSELQLSFQEFYLFIYLNVFSSDPTCMYQVYLNKNVLFRFSFGAALHTGKSDKLNKFSWICIHFCRSPGKNLTRPRSCNPAVWTLLG